MTCISVLAASLILATASAGANRQTLRDYVIEADAIRQSLTGQSGNPARGAMLIGQRQKSLCILCHSGPFPDPHLQGTIAPDLTGVGNRLSAGQLRLRIVDMKRLNPRSIMPSYYTVSENSAARVAPEWRGKPLLTAQDIEDLVAYLETLKSERKPDGAR